MQPPCDGRQFIDNPYYRHSYDVTYDQYGDERAEDLTMHTSGAVGDQGSIYSGRDGQDFNYTKGGTYGVQIAHEDSPGVNVVQNWERTSADVSRADRGSDS